MEFIDYMKHRKVSQKEMAKIINYGQSNVSLIARKLKKPSLRFAYAVYKESQGMVSWEDWNIDLNGK